ncbi:MAG: putative bifunctional diguanylate cyclase/phosphodiesterase [Pseudorhodoplanes sp.]
MRTVGPLGLLRLVSPGPPDKDVAGRRRALAAFILPLICFALGGILALAALGHFWSRQLDAERDLRQRDTLRAAVMENLSSFGDADAPSSATLRAIEQATGLSQLRFETEPAARDREAQPVVDSNGRILGWLTWTAKRSALSAWSALWPVAGVLLAGLAILLALVALRLHWLSRALSEAAVRTRTLADRDPLTGLPHHAAMLALVERALAERKAAEVAAFVHLDIDGFKELNDTFGHGVGTELLSAVADRLTVLLPDNAFGGRFGNDEFVAFVRAADEETASADIRTVVAGLSRPYWVQNRAVQISVSAGAAFIPQHGTAIDELTRRADLSLHVAKDQKRGQLVAFEHAMDVEFLDRRALERELRKALAHEQFVLHYQPIVSASGAELIGVEALLRWDHPERGFVPPLSFVPIAERSGLMKELGQFVLRRALTDARRWPGLSIAVNLSPVQVRDPALPDVVAAELAASGIAPDRLLLEVTEGLLIDNPAEAKQRLEKVRALGVRLALDDFGTGYSSLAYLQNFSFDKLKIDKSFVDPLGRSANSAAMIQAIVALGRALGMTVLVEGVETEEQRVLLRLAGCDEMQGFLFAWPMAREDVDALLMEKGEAGRARANGRRA